jgi:Peptidase family M1 domain/Peptidase M1 N-terminal domain/Dockerin type I domain
MNKIVVFLIVILAMTAILQAELYQPLKKSNPPPLTMEKFREMLETRTEKHACMKKAERLLETNKFNLYQSYTEPTPNQLDYDVLHYEINLDLDFNSEYISGNTKITLASLVDNLGFIDLNLGYNYVISQVTLNDTINLNYTVPDWFYFTSYLPEIIDSGEVITLTVHYSGNPNEIGYMMYYNDFGSHVCFTSCEPFGSRFWWACKDFPFDKPDSVDIIITHPSNYSVASNGLRQSITDHGNGRSTTHWHESFPIATYLVAIGVTDYERFDQSWEYYPGQFMPVEQYYFPGAPPQFDWSSAFYYNYFTIPSLEALSYWFTLYPFVSEKYGHYHFGWGGAMEHQTCTAISPTFNSEYVIAHECAHQWGGDLITCRNFHHMWLNEGFASYAEALYLLYHYDEEYYKMWLNFQKHTDAGTPYVEDLENDNVFDGPTVYDKGGWVFYMLHMVLGDDGFRTAMDMYFHDPDLRFKSAYTSDLQRVCESVYGAPMGWFFNQWIYEPGNPDYVYSYMEEEKINSSGYSVNLFINQVQEWTTFVMPIEIQAFAGGFDTTFTVFNYLRGQLFQFDLPSAPDSIKVDPNEKILCTVEHDPGFSVHIIGQDLPNGIQWEPYHVDFEAVGGSPPYNWSKAAGQIPYGLILETGANASLDGTPTWVSDFAFSLQVEDSSNPPDTSTYHFTINVDPPPPLCGDANGDQEVNITDVVYALNYIYMSGPAPDPLETGDVNCDGKINLVDAIYIVNYIFRGGAEPCAGCSE